jgi:hypothetical protein
MRMTNFTKTALALFVAAGCGTSPDSDAKLPSASFTPHLDTTATPVACGDNVALYGDTTPDLVYAFAYDSNGMISHAEGVYAAGGPDETTDYTWSGYNMTHMLDQNGWGSARTEITATYDSSSDLTDYVWDYTAGTYHDNWDYAMSSFVNDEPTREVLTEQGQPSFGYTLQYDANGRLTEAVPDDGSAPEFWTYDDTGLTISYDIGNGDWHGTYVYDDQYRELSDTEGGTDPYAIESTDIFAWNGDQLSTETYSSGTETSPDNLELVETDTLLYNCPAARAATGHSIRTPRPLRAAR